MKKIAVLLVLVLLMVSCQKKDVIEIKTENLPDNTKVEVYIRNLDFDAPDIVISGDIVGGKLELDNPFKKSEWAFLSIKESKDVNHTILFIGQPGTITINFDKDNPNKSIIGGTEDNNEMQAFMDEIRVISVEVDAYVEKTRERMEQLSESASNEEEQEELKKLRKQYVALTTQYDVIIEKYQQDNKDNIVGLIMLIELLNTRDKSLTEYKTDFDNYPESIKTSYFGKRVEEYIQSLIKEEQEIVKLEIGDKLPEFKGLTPEDKKLTLSTFLEDKKLVLVDVWASWCGPCRQENPNVVKTYEEYHKLGFDIIGYSLDKDKVAWVKAITDDNLTWKNVSNLQFWKDPIVKDYGIQGIPANYLIDGNGVIVAMDLRGNELGDKVKELLVK